MLAWDGNREREREMRLVNKTGVSPFLGCPTKIWFECHVLWKVSPGRWGTQSQGGIVLLSSTVGASKRVRRWTVTGEMAGLDPVAVCLERRPMSMIFWGLDTSEINWVVLLLPQNLWVCVQTLGPEWYHSCTDYDWLVRRVIFSVNHVIFLSHSILIQTHMQHPVCQAWGFIHSQQRDAAERPAWEQKGRVAWRRCRWKSSTIFGNVGFYHWLKQAHCM